MNIPKIPHQVVSSEGWNSQKVAVFICHPTDIKLNRLIDDSPNVLFTPMVSVFCPQSLLRSHLGE